MDIINSTSTLLQPMAGEGLHPEPIGSTNNRNRVRSSRAPSGGAGFNSPRRAAPL